MSSQDLARLRLHMFYAPFHSKKQGVLHLANLTLQHVLFGIQNKSGMAWSVQLTASWLVSQCHLNHCVSLREAVRMRDERRRNARERTPFRIGGTLRTGGGAGR